LKLSEERRGGCHESMAKTPTHEGFQDKNARVKKKISSEISYIYQTFASAPV
jgi:hypothetical protein